MSENPFIRAQTLFTVASSTMYQSIFPKNRAGKFTFPLPLRYTREQEGKKLSLHVRSICTSGKFHNLLEETSIGLYTTSNGYQMTKEADVIVQRGYYPTISALCEEINRKIVELGMINDYKSNVTLPSVAFINQQVVVFKGREHSYSGDILRIYTLRIPLNLRRIFKLDKYWKLAPVDYLTTRVEDIQGSFIDNPEIPYTFRELHLKCNFSSNSLAKIPIAEARDKHIRYPTGSGVPIDESFNWQFLSFHFENEMGDIVDNDHGLTCVKLLFSGNAVLEDSDDEDLRFSR